jgi:hypothetical protein
VPVEVTYDLPRERGTALGDLPIPAGVVSVYETAPDGSAQLIGRSSLRHSPPGAPLQVNLGASFDVSASRSQTSYQVERTGDDGRTMGAVIGFREEIINAGDTAVTVTTYETRYGEWEMLESSHPTERLESGAIAIPVRIPARGRVVVTYRLRLAW